MTAHEIKELTLCVWRICEVYGLADEDKADLIALCNLVSENTEVIAKEEQDGKKECSDI